MDSSPCRQVWNRFYGALRAYYFSQDQIMCLFNRCVVWFIVLYASHRYYRFFLDRQRDLRHRAHRDRSNTERADLKQLWSEVLSPTSNEDKDLEHPGLAWGTPRRSRTASKHQATSVTSDAPVSKLRRAAEEGPHLVTLLISTRCTPYCAHQSTCAQELKEAAAGLSARGQNVRHLQASGSFIQTQVMLMNDTASKLRGLAAQKYCDYSVQLGRFWASCLSDGAVKTFKLEESLMPVILHSSFAVGILTVEGLNLSEATIQLASENKCISLETRCMKGPGGLEMHTCMCQLPFKGLAEVSVLAFKQIDMDGHTIRVSSAAVAIQDENFRTVFQYILPFWILSILGIGQILSSDLNLVDSSSKTFSIIAIMIVIATQITPQSWETSIRVFLKELLIQIYLTLYFTFQSFMHEIAIFPSFTAEDPSQLLRVAERDLSRPSPPVAPRTLGQLHGDIFGQFFRMPEGPSSEPGDSLSEDQAPSNVINPISSSDQWQWPVYDTFYDDFNKPRLVLRGAGKKTKTNATSTPFKVIYLNLKNLPWANQVLVRIYSPFLKEAIVGLEANQRTLRKSLKMSGPALFHVRGKLRERCNSLVASQQEPSSSSDANTDSRELQHLSHLVRFMDEEFKEIEQMYTAMKEERRATWKMLWAFFPQGEEVFFCDAQTEEPLCGSVLKAQYQIQEDNTAELVITVSKWDYNCEAYKKFSEENLCYTITVPAFENKLSIESLSIHPVQYEMDPEASVNTFLERGTKFCELSMKQRSNFMNYKGSMIRLVRVNNCYQVVKEFADGRVMIDPGSFAEMNPSYPMLSAQPPCKVIRDNKVECIDISTSRDRMFAPSLVYGFSFRLKSWGSFSVGGFADIVFNDAAYDDLVMDANKKDLMENLVRQHLESQKNKEPEDYIAKVDPIVNKGEGCVFLCYGPPGTGKTLSAESLSEKLHCPLWSLSVSELGTTPSALEERLMQVMDVAALWGAILLLDEADVYLEQRSSSDLSRNAMTGVFLRHLEYYRGVLFLTTNRDSALDEAITSRIAHFLYYARHNKEQRGTIWSNLFRHAGLKAPSEVVIEFSEPEINGREIRNIMQTAKTLARGKKKEVEVEDVRQALTVYVDSFKLRASLTPSSASGPFSSSCTQN